MEPHGGSIRSVDEQLELSISPLDRPEVPAQKARSLHSCVACLCHCSDHEVADGETSQFFRAQPERQSLVSTLTSLPFLHPALHPKKPTHHWRTKRGTNRTQTWTAHGNSIALWRHSQLTPTASIRGRRYFATITPHTHVAASTCGDTVLASTDIATATIGPPNSPSGAYSSFRKHESKCSWGAVRPAAFFLTRYVLAAVSLQSRRAGKRCKASVLPIPQ